MYTTASSHKADRALTAADQMNCCACSARLLICSACGAAAAAAAGPPISIAPVVRNSWICGDGKE
jgi:hypothetical protein